QNSNGRRSEGASWQQPVGSTEDSPRAFPHGRAIGKPLLSTSATHRGGSVLTNNGARCRRSRFRQSGPRLTTAIAEQPRQIRSASRRRRYIVFQIVTVSRRGVIWP